MMKATDLQWRILRLLEDVHTQNEMIIRQNVELLIAITTLAEERGKESAQTEGNSKVAPSGTEKDNYLHPTPR